MLETQPYDDWLEETLSLRREDRGPMPNFYWYWKSGVSPRHAVESEILFHVPLSDEKYTEWLVSLCEIRNSVLEYPVSPYHLDRIYRRVYRQGNTPKEAFEEYTLRMSAYEHWGFLFAKNVFYMFPCAEGEGWSGTEWEAQRDFSINRERRRGRLSRIDTFFCQSHQQSV